MQLIYIINFYIFDRKILTIINRTLNILILTFSINLYCQSFDKVIKLPKVLKETSALEYHGDNFITLNDSGSKAVLYEFNVSGEIINEFYIDNANNYDWESLAKDNDCFFIGDIGNNYGIRDNLKIYKIGINNFKKIDEIKFSYKNQTKFNLNKYTEYDAEAITTFKDMLLMFSKNRKSLTTEGYLISKIPGEYIIEPTFSFDVEGLITGADYNDNLKLLMLVGYDFSGTQFICKVENFNPYEINKNNIKKIVLPIDKAQMEGIKIVDLNTFWITSEDEGKKSSPRLFRIKL